MHPQRRRFRLVRPKLQLSLMLSFLGISVLALLVQYLVFIQVMTQLAAELPDDGGLLMGEIPKRLQWVLFGSFALVTPAILYVGVLTTKRIVGPIYRFETYLKQVLEGKMREECRIREGDEFTELCALINRATLRQRESSGETTSEVEPARKSPRAAA